MLAKLAELWIDDTGALTDGTMTKVDQVIGHSAMSQTKTSEAPIARGDSFVREAGEAVKVSISGSLKFKKSDALIARLRAAQVAMTATGVLSKTSDGTGSEECTYDALVTAFDMKAESGNHVIYDFSMVLHDDSADPTFTTTA